MPSILKRKNSGFPEHKPFFKLVLPQKIELFFMTFRHNLHTIAFFVPPILAAHRPESQVMKLESFLEYPIPPELRKAAKKDSCFIARTERYLVSGGAALPLHGKSVSVKACHQDIKRVRFSMWKNNNMIEKSHHDESCFSTNILVGLLPSNS